MDFNHVIRCDDDDDDYYYYYYGGGDDDDYNEFLFQSIRRYDTLQMFNLENVPVHLLQLDSDSLCVAGKTARRSSELLKLKLPGKLTLPPEKEGLSKENDFKVLSAIYIDNPIYQIGKFACDNNSVLTSETNITGLQIHSFTDNLIGNTKKVQKLGAVPWTNPDFIVMQENQHLICSKYCHEPLIQVDAFTGKKLKDIKHPFYRIDVLAKESSKTIDSVISNHIKCSALSADLIGVLNTHGGKVFLHDLRTNGTFVSLPGLMETITTEIWTLSGSNIMEHSLDYFGILSNATSFCVYDIRKNGIVFQRKGKSPLVKNHFNMKLKFSGKERKFSISGMNSFVEIFRIDENNFEKIFTHNGHCPNDVPSGFVTDHVWLQNVRKEIIVSICDNKTLNCWN